MALQIEAVNPHELIEFIPQFAGERAKAEKDADYKPLLFHLRRMTEREAEAFNEFRVVDGEIEINQEDCARIAIRHAVKIENFQLRTPGGVAVTIGSGEQFAEYRDQLPGGLKHLVTEVAIEVIRLSSLTEEEGKN